MSASEMRVEEGDDAAAGVHRSGLAESDVSIAKHLEPEALLVVHERVAGVGIFLDVVRDESAFESLLKLIGDALFPVALGPVASDDRAGDLEKGFHIGRELATIVDAGGREAVA